MMDEGANDQESVKIVDFKGDLFGSRAEKKLVRRRLPRLKPRKLLDNKRCGQRLETLKFREGRKDFSSLSINFRPYRC